MDVQLGERDAHPTASASGGTVAGGSPTSNAARMRAAARSALAVVARVHDGDRAAARADLLPQPGDVDQADRVVDALVLAQPPAAQLEHRDADVAHGDRADVPGVLGEHLEHAPRAREVAVGVVEQVGRAAERRAHAREALGRRAGGERLAGGGARLRVGRVQPAEPQQRRAQRERDLDEARLGGARVGERAERLADLDGVAGRAAEHLVHVGEQRLARQPVAAGDGHDRPCQLARSARGSA